MDYQAARQAMIDGQIRPNKVIDNSIITAFKRIPREAFLPLNKRNIAYLDEDIIVEGGRCLMQPSILGQLLQAAQPSSDDNALVVAAGAGYCVALLGSIVHSVTALDNFGDKTDNISAAFTSFGIDTVDVEAGNPAQGYAGNAPYSLIIIDGAVACVPDALFAQLAQGGRLLAIVRPHMQAAGVATLFQKSMTSSVISHRALFDAFVPILPEFAPSEDFVF